MELVTEFGEPHRHLLNGEGGGGGEELSPLFGGKVREKYLEGVNVIAGRNRSTLCLGELEGGLGSGIRNPFHTGDAGGRITLYRSTAGGALESAR